MNMRGIALLVLAAVIVVWSFAAQAQALVHARPGPVPALKAEVTVTGDFVRVGDLLEHAGKHASQPLFRAPQLGASGTIQLHRVMEALRSVGIVVFDAKNIGEVLVTRTARTVSLNDLSRAIAEAAVARYELSSAADIAVNFDPHMKPLQVEPHVEDAPRIVSVSFDPRNNRFEAVVDMPGSITLRRSPVRFTGTLVETVEVVTLARAISRSETIRESDLIVERLPRAAVPQEALTKAELVVNQAARRALRSGQTLRAADLMKPQIVSRDETVTIVFKAGGITLTARGKSMGNGAEGETVSVLNPQSKRVIQATITSPGVVTVGDLHPVTTAAIPQQ